MPGAVVDRMHRLPWKRHDGDASYPSAVPLAAGPPGNQRPGSGAEWRERSDSSSGSRLTRSLGRTAQLANSPRTVPTRDESPTPSETDPLAPLMAAIRGGSQSALGQLMDRCWPELVRYAARQVGEVDLARDIVQETLIQVWERRRAWEPRGSVRAYLYRIVRNLVIDEKRRQGVRRRWAQRQEFALSPAARNAGRSSGREAADRGVRDRRRGAPRTSPRGLRTRLPAGTVARETRQP